MKYIKTFEKYGVPADIDMWVKNMYDNIVGILQTMQNMGKDNLEMYSTDIEGENVSVWSLYYLNEGIDSSISFPDSSVKLKNLTIELTCNIIPNKFKEVKNYWNAYYLNKPDNYIDDDGFIHDCEFYFDLYFKEELLDVDDIDLYLKNNNIKSSLMEYISHEMTHMYEFYRRRLSGVKTWSELSTNSIINALNSYLNQVGLTGVSDSINELFYLIYISSGFEINARVTQVYYNLKHSNVNIETWDDFMREFSKTEVYSDLVRMKSFDPLKWYHDFRYNDDLAMEYLKLNNIKYGTFANYNIDDIEIKDIIIREFINDWDSIIDVMKDNHLDIQNLPRQYKEDPKLFVNYYNKRIKKYAKKLEDKINKVYFKLKSEN